MVVEECQNFRPICCCSEELAVEGVEIDLSEYELFQGEGAGQVEIGRLVVGFCFILGCKLDVAEIGAVFYQLLEISHSWQNWLSQSTIPQKIFQRICCLFEEPSFDCVLHHLAGPLGDGHYDLIIFVRRGVTLFLLEISLVAEHGKEGGMDDLGGRGVFGEGGVDSEEEGVESAQADGVHAFGLGDGVVFE